MRPMIIPTCRSPTGRCRPPMSISSFFSRVARCGALSLLNRTRRPEIVSGRAPEGVAVAVLLTKLPRSRRQRGVWTARSVLYRHVDAICHGHWRKIREPKPPAPDGRYDCRAVTQLSSQVGYMNAYDRALNTEIASHDPL